MTQDVQQIVQQPAEIAGRIKDLEWAGNDYVLVAKHPFGRYKIAEDRSHWVVWDASFTPLAKVPKDDAGSLDRAKAHANHDLRRKVHECVEAAK